MNHYFADTSYWIAIFNRGDDLHLKATSTGRKLRDILVTTQWILTEMLDGLSNTEGMRESTAAFVRDLELEPNVAIIPATEEWFHRGLVRYEQRLDKEWSLTDCISIVVVEDEGIADALTGDHHFEQAGFNALLR